MSYWVYILASRRHGTLYVGVTNDVFRRAGEHRRGELPGFTKRYDVRRLVRMRAYGEITEAIAFEKRLKRWRRDWKIALIEAENPTWGDPYEGMATAPAASAFIGPGQPLRGFRVDTQFSLSSRPERSGEPGPRNTGCGKG